MFFLREDAPKSPLDDHDSSVIYPLQLLFMCSCNFRCMYKAFKHSNLICFTYFHLAIASPAPSSALVTRAVSPGKQVLPSPTSTQELGTGISNACCITIMIRK